MNLAPYRKTVTALVAGGLGWAAQIIASPENPITASEWLAGGTALAVSLGVYSVPNSIGRLRAHDAT